MNESMMKRIQKLENHCKDLGFKEVTFQIGGQDANGNSIESIAIVNGEEMPISDFNEKYPDFKPTGVTFTIGEWEE